VAWAVRGRLQIVYGLLASKEGIPVAIEVFKGNTGDRARGSDHRTAQQRLPTGWPGGQV